MAFPPTTLLNVFLGFARVAFCKISPPLESRKLSADAPVLIPVTGAFGNAVDGAMAFGPITDGSKG